MPVRKFRDVSEMEDNTWREPGDPALLRAIAAVWDLARRILQPRFPPGVYRHRTIEEAQRLRDAWEQANLDALRARRRETREADGDR